MRRVPSLIKPFWRHLELDANGERSCGDHHFELGVRPENGHILLPDPDSGTCVRGQLP